MRIIPPILVLLTALACPAFSEDTQTLIKKAEGGDPEAQVNLGVAYSAGKEVVSEVRRTGISARPILARTLVLQGEVGFSKIHEQSPEDQGRYEFREQEAKAKNAGLWQDKNPVPPWEFRKLNNSVLLHWDRCRRTN